jgi:hypothetical protein
MHSKHHLTMVQHKPCQLPETGKFLPVGGNFLPPTDWPPRQKRQKSGKTKTGTAIAEPNAGPRR